MARSYLDLREKLEKKDRGLKEKVKSLSEAVVLIPDDAHVAIGGCHYSRTPMALVWEIIRQKKKGLVISKSITATEGDLFLLPARRGILLQVGSVLESRGEFQG